MRKEEGEEQKERDFELARPEYIGPISNRDGPNLSISALSSSALLKD